MHRDYHLGVRSNFQSFDGVAIYIVHLHTITNPPSTYPYILVFELILQVQLGIMYGVLRSVWDDGASN